MVFFPLALVAYLLRPMLFAWMEVIIVVIAFGTAANSVSLLSKEKWDWDEKISAPLSGVTAVSCLALPALGFIIITGCAIALVAFLIIGAIFFPDPKMRE